VGVAVVPLFPISDRPTMLLHARRLTIKDKVERFSEKNEGFVRSKAHQDDYFSEV
jgi:hypothetical protein